MSTIRTAPCDEVSVTNTTTQTTWVTGRQATAPELPPPTHYNVRVPALGNRQPPPGFFNNANYLFVIRARYLVGREWFQSAPATYNAAQSEPPDIYTFSV
jgi:hypothetical protein